MSGTQQHPSAAEDLATVAAGVDMADGHPFVPGQVARALRALLRLVTAQHHALQDMRRALNNLKGAR